MNLQYIVTHILFWAKWKLIFLDQRHNREFYCKFSIRLSKTISRASTKRYERHWMTFRDVFFAKSKNIRENMHIKKKDMVSFRNDNFHRSMPSFWLKPNNPAILYISVSGYIYFQCQLLYILVSGDIYF